MRNFLAFLIVGGTTALLYFLLLVIFLEVLRLEYLIGVSVAYVAAIVFHFALNRYLIFKATDSSLLGQGSRYAVMATVNYLMNLAIVFMVVEQLGFNAYIGAVTAIAVSTLLSYAVSKVWVFRRRRTS